MRKHSWVHTEDELIEIVDRFVNEYGSCRFSIDTIFGARSVYMPVAEKSFVGRYLSAIGVKASRVTKMCYRLPTCIDLDD